MRYTVYRATPPYVHGTPVGWSEDREDAVAIARSYRRATGIDHQVVSGGQDAERIYDTKEGPR